MVTHGNAPTYTGLIHYTELWQQPDEHGKYTLELYNPNRFMRLDAAALRALHVFGEGAGGASASFSLYALLSKAKTAMGKRLVKVGCCIGLGATHVVHGVDRA